MGEFAQFAQNLPEVSVLKFAQFDQGFLHPAEVYFQPGGEFPLADEEFQVQLGQFPALDKNFYPPNEELEFAAQAR